MAHYHTQNAYRSLTSRLNRFPQGAPESKMLFEILSMLFSEKEARLVSLLPIKPFKADKASKVWRKDITETRKILEKLAGKAVLLDIEYEGESVYVLPPPMAGFFEFSMMRLREDIDQKLLSKLYYQYMNVEEDFIRELFLNGETQLGRTFVHEPALPSENAIEVLDYEKASEVIKSASCMGISICYCRHKMYHMGKVCTAPMEICMTFNSTAVSLVKHGHARKVDKNEGLDLLQRAYDNKLVQFGDNVRQRVNFICNCCGCCCEAMLAQKKFSLFAPVHTTNFIPSVDQYHCRHCGKCVNVCPVEAMSLVSASDPKDPKRKKAKLNRDLCLGCGLCVRECPLGNIVLKSREKRVITPLNGVHRAVVMAIERGTLHHLIFDNQVLKSHRALGAVLHVMLKLPLIKQTLALQQVKSRYLEAFLRMMDSVYPI